MEQLFNALTDKVSSYLPCYSRVLMKDMEDTIVRWSAAKGMARISERLPGDLAVQVLDTLFGLFSIHSTAETALSDLPEVAEGTWHGACLACAEMARRGVIAPDRLSEFIEWSSKVWVYYRCIELPLNQLLSKGALFRYQKRSSFDWFECSGCCSLCLMGAS